MIEVHVLGDVGLVWDAQDSAELTEKHRIVGSCIGTLPGHNSQNMFFGMPLLLSPEEVTLLLANRVIRVVQVDPTVPPDAVTLDAYKAGREAFVQHQIARMSEAHFKKQEAHRIRRKEEMAEYRKKYNLSPVEAADASSAEPANATEITLAVEPLLAPASASAAETSHTAGTHQTEEAQSSASKRAKDSDKDKDTEATPDERDESGAAAAGAVENATQAFWSRSALEQFLFPIGAELPPAAQAVQSLTPETEAYLRKQARIVVPGGCRRRDQPLTQPASWTFPRNAEERRRYRVFADLWERGYFLTSASKFGGHYLAYPGDPQRYHSHFIVIVMPYDRNMTALDVVSYGRLGTVVKKAPLIATVDKQDKVEYLSLEWTGSN
eukprot:m.74556 g.74556  ORF g.74556 m.74556 type:complete len:381 (-) comp17110_c0_seq1:75-1217(-)